MYWKTFFNVLDPRSVLPARDELLCNLEALSDADVDKETPLIVHEEDDESSIGSVLLVDDESNDGDDNVTVPAVAAPPPAAAAAEATGSMDKQYQPLKKSVPRYLRTSDITEWECYTVTALKKHSAAALKLTLPAGAKKADIVRLMAEHCHSGIDIGADETNE